MKQNMNDFNRCAAMVLTRLHDAFPRHISIDIRDLDDDADQSALDNFRSTVRFLADEGFIRYNSVTMAGCFTKVQLTARGLTILNAVPDAIQEKTDYASAIKKTLMEGSKEALKAVIGKVFENAMPG